MLAGPKIGLLPIRQVILVATAPPDSLDKEVTYVATMTYVNTGHPGQNDAVIRERLEFKLNDKQRTYKADWHKFVVFDETTDFIKKGTTARAFVINAGGAEAHETWFAPRDDEHRLKLKKFTATFEDLLTGDIETLEWQIEFHGETIKDGETSEVCTVTLSARRIQALRDPNIGWVALNCKRE